MKKLLIFSLILLIAGMLPIPARADGCSAKAMIVYEPRTGTVLAEQNADEELLIASTTKIMTALVVLESCALDEPVTITPAQTMVEGSSMYAAAGETYTVEELLYGLLLASGNDAALALAEHTAGSVEAFAQRMNDKCAELGLSHSHFVNPHGLDAEGHYSSARDLALLTAAAMELPDFCRIFAAEQYTVHGICYTNHNKLLHTCQGCIGGKTGYTKAAGRILVSCAERDGFRLICVTISDPDDWTDHCRAYDEAFRAYRYYALPQDTWKVLPLNSGLRELLPLTTDVKGVVLPAGTRVEIRPELPRFVFAPVAGGEVLGRVSITADGEDVLSVPVRAAEDCALDPCVPLTGKERLQRGWDMYCRYGIYRIYPMGY